MGTTLNRHIHKLEADHTSYNREMGKSAKNTSKLSKSNQSLVSSIALVDGPLGGVASRASNLNSIFKGGGAILGTFAIGLSAVGFGAVKTLGVLGEVELEMNKINNLVRATGGSTGLLAEEFDAMSRSIALDTMASTTDIRQAVASLMTFRSVGSDIFEPTIRLSQDMAAVWGGSAATNARKLGKALEDPVKQLSRLETTVGAFDSTTRDAILTMAKMGDKAGAQAKILKALEDRIGGAANAFGLPGAKDTLAQRWTEFFEAVGESTGVGRAATNMLNGLADALKNMTEGLTPETSEQRIADLTLKRVKLMTNLATEQRKLNVLTNQEKMGSADENRVIQQRSVLELRRNEITILDNEILKQRAIIDLKGKAKAEEKAAALQKEKTYKAEQAAIEKSIRDKAELDEMQKWIDEGSIIRFKAMGKAAEEEIKARAKMQEEFEKLRETGLTSIEKENELNKNNVVFLNDYRKEFGQTAALEKALMAEKERHIGKMNDLKFDKNKSILSARMGEPTEAANDEFDYLSIEREKEQHQTRLDMIAAFREEDITNKKAADAMLEEEQQRHSDSMVRLSEQEAASKKNAMSMFFGAAATLMSSKSRKLFEIGKMGAIAQAVVNTALGVTEALKLGPIIGPPLAAMQAAAGIVQIQAINNTEFGGGASVTTGASAISGAEPAFQAPTDTRKEVNFVFNGNISGMDADHIANMLKEHIDSTDFVLIESSSRNGQELVA